MVERRQLLKAAMFGGLVTHPGMAVDGSAQSIPDRQANEIVDALKNVSKAIATANSFSEIAEVRLRVARSCRDDSFDRVLIVRQGASVRCAAPGQSGDQKRGKRRVISTDCAEQRRR
jgi:hypothetical protein